MKFNAYDLLSMDTKILLGEANISKDKVNDLVKEMFGIEENIAIIL
ncbi:hypothetical protein [Tissierella sp. Yu-01]|nr:hypothetical protein [Tissierella sp. Yu-01]WFA09506.1 hypothetical protein P3962_02845 [Tissierella sp. Yu-01]